MTADHAPLSDAQVAGLCRPELPDHLLYPVNILARVELARRKADAERFDRDAELSASWNREMATLTAELEQLRAERDVLTDGANTPLGDTYRAGVLANDALEAELERYRNLLCPPLCETCGGEGENAPQEYRHSCPVCHGRPKPSLYGRVDSIVRLLDGDYESALDVPNAIEALRTILADVAKAMTP